MDHRTSVIIADNSEDFCSYLTAALEKTAAFQVVGTANEGEQAVLLVSLELDEVMSLSDRILVMYEGEIVGELDPKATTVQELGLYMAGAKRMGKEAERA